MSGENLYLKPQEASRVPLRAVLFSTAVEPLMRGLGLAISIVVYCTLPIYSNRGRQSDDALLVKAEKCVMRAKMLAKNI